MRESVDAQHGSAPGCAARTGLARIARDRPDGPRDAMESSNGGAAAMAWGSALGITAVYVGSLYLWPEVPSEGRNHPRTVRKRFASLAGACAAACVPVMRAITASPVPEAVARAGVTPPASLVGALGIAPRPMAAATSTAASLGLAAALFLGPLTHLAIDGRLRRRFVDALRLDTTLKLRDYAVAPLSEEFAFRACVATSLAWSGSCTVASVVFLSPMCFGAAHLHHFRELRRRGLGLVGALAAIGAQFAYTTAFGWFATFTFLRTGHLCGPVFAHSFCNVMGLPDLRGALAHRRRSVICGAYVVGIAAFIAGLWPATDPRLHPGSAWDDLVAVGQAATGGRGGG